MYNDSKFQIFEAGPKFQQLYMYVQIKLVHTLSNTALCMYMYHVLYIDNTSTSNCTTLYQIWCSVSVYYKL